MDGKGMTAPTTADVIALLREVAGRYDYTIEMAGGDDLDEALVGRMVAMADALAAHREAGPGSVCWHGVPTQCSNCAAESGASAPTWTKGEMRR